MSFRPRVLVGLTGALFACVAPLSDDALRAQLREVGGVSGSSADRVVAINAASEAEAWTRVAEARSSGPSELSRRLVRALQEPDLLPARFVVGGPYAQLNDQTLSDVFARIRKPTLSGLSIVFVSPRAPTPALLASARELDVRVQHRPYPETP